MTKLVSNLIFLLVVKNSDNIKHRSVDKSFFLHLALCQRTNENFVMFGAKIFENSITYSGVTVVDL